MPSRRFEWIALSLVSWMLLLGGPANSQGPPEPPPAVMAGPLVGHVWDSGARLWIQTDAEGAYFVDYRQTGSSEWQTPRRNNGRDDYFRIWPDTAFSGTYTLQGLEPSTTYEYRFRSSKGPLESSGKQTFRTPPRPGQPENFSLGFGSCAGRWGKRPEQPVFEAITARSPDVFLFLGDNNYFDRVGQEWSHPELMWASYVQARRQPNAQALFRQSSIYAIWDDHDYGPDNSDKLYPLKDVALHLFRTFWPNPSYGSDGAPGIWTTFTRGKVQFFLLDGRYYREPNHTPDSPHKTQWGKAQRDWLAKSLARSSATFKVIVSGGQFLAKVHDDESHNLFRFEREWLLHQIRQEQISGVVFLTGDRHIGEILRWLPPEVPYPLYEMTSSPLAAGVSSHEPPDEEVQERLPGSLVQEENFGWIDFDFPPDGSPTLTFQHYDYQGQPVGQSLTLTAEQLQFP